MRTNLTRVTILTVAALAVAHPAPASPFFFSTGDTDGKIATATRPATSGGPFEIEAADDFVLTSPTMLTSATFMGLMPATSSVTQVVVEIYRVFPNDSNTSRTPNVPTRVNSPSDVAFGSRDSAAGQLNFATTMLGSFTANNSVRPGGISLNVGGVPGGDGPVTDEEVQFDVTFTTPIMLPTDHYFFVPQVLLDTSGNPGTANSDFLWLSAPRPIVAPGTPFPAGFTDLQSWTRDAALDPDWMRVGTDIVGGNPAPTFNETFSLTGDITVPEPATLALFGGGLAGLGLIRRKRA